MDYVAQLMEDFGESNLALFGDAPMIRHRNGIFRKAPPPGYRAHNKALGAETTPCVFRPAAKSNGETWIEGQATVWNRLHQGEKHFEAFAVGAFGRSLCGKKAIRFLVMHDEAKLVATTADNLELKTDREALWFRLRLPDTPQGREAKELVERCGGMSVGFKTIVEEMLDIDGTKVRFLKDCDLVEISAVTRGAVEEAFAVVRQDDEGPLSGRKSLHSICSEKAMFKMKNALNSLARAVG